MEWGPSAPDSRWRAIVLTGPSLLAMEQQSNTLLVFPRRALSKKLIPRQFSSSVPTKSLSGSGEIWDKATNNKNGQIMHLDLEKDVRFKNDKDIIGSG
jgi:hypothetical protein